MVTIRKATKEDLVQLQALYYDFHNFHAKYIGTRLAYLNPCDDPELRAALIKIITDEDAALLVAELGERMVGLAEAYIKQTEANPAIVPRSYALLQSLMVVETERKLGIGKLLVQAVECWAKERGVLEMETEVWAFPQGPLAFYEGLGYSTFKQRLNKSL